MKSAFIHSRELESYHYPAACPFRTERAAQAFALCRTLGLFTPEARNDTFFSGASEEQLLHFHTARYLETLRLAARGQLNEAGLFMGLGTPDTPVFSDLYTYAALVCGATLHGAERILRQEVLTAFNPSGGYHHAGPDRAAGFCYLNDVALACQRLAATGRRVLYLDLDAHHGDGVQDAFYDRPDVLTVSLHESGKTLFPGTGFPDEIGTGAGTGYCLNIPLPEKTYDEAYLGVFQDIVMPVAAWYAPDYIVLEIGLDFLAGDPLAHLNLTNNVLCEIIPGLLRLARPVLATGGGGYHPENTARGWALAWSLLSGADRPDDLALGLGGVMIGNREWPGGLRDPGQRIGAEEQRIVDAEIDRTTAQIKDRFFRLHNL